MAEIHIFPCLNDNYGFLLHDEATGETAAIDVPEARRVLEEAAKRNWSISQIWLTHHHPDHIGGAREVQEKTGASVFGPAREADQLAGLNLDRALDDDDGVSLGSLNAFVMTLPGHTLGHIVYVLPEAGHAFVGDVMFVMGCGRLFEGTPEMMWTSLQRLRALDPAMKIWCAHEYTLTNARFAKSVESGNADVSQALSEAEALRAQDQPTVPTTIGRELKTNPFLRADRPELAEAIGLEGAKPVDVFAELRRRRDHF